MDDVIWVLLLWFIVIMYVIYRVLYLAIIQQVHVGNKGEITFPRKPDLSKTIRAIIQSKGELLYDVF
jgi:hypothetical protein